VDNDEKFEVLGQPQKKGIDLKAEESNEEVINQVADEDWQDEQMRTTGYDEMEDAAMEYNGRGRYGYYFDDYPSRI
jgi:hypothetical protein